MIMGPPFSFASTGYAAPSTSSTRATLPICSLSRRVWDRLQSASGLGRVLGRFRRAVDLLIDGKVLALVTPEIGDGPFHVVLPYLPSDPLPQRFTMRVDDNVCALGPWRLSMRSPPRLWDARPRWEHLSPSPTTTLSVLRRIVETAACDISHSPVAALTRGEDVPRIAAFERALRSQKARPIHDAAAKLAGWGPGLTPSGDDYLVGAMLALWYLAPDDVERPEFSNTLDSGFSLSASILCSWITRAAAPRTNRISRAFLKAARDGLADARWHTLLETLAAGDGSAVQQAARSILDFGATSGLDTLIGFWRILERFSKVETFTR